MMPVTRAGYGNEVRCALRFFLFFVFSYLLLCIALDLGTRICTHALREHFEPTILRFGVIRRRFASGSETNFSFFCLLLFYVSVLSPEV